MTLPAITTSSWYQYLNPHLRQLVDTAWQLHGQQAHPASCEIETDDYSYIVFPMAKAYEGFLKQYFLDTGLISPEVYTSRRFRIGRALNPDVYEHQRDEDWLYDDLERRCSPTLARLLWETWLECRNRLFHYYPEKHRQLNQEQAGRCLLKMAEAMAAAVACRQPPPPPR